jgi:hypothetical protein
MPGPAVEKHRRVRVTVESARRGYRHPPGGGLGPCSARASDCPWSRSLPVRLPRRAAGASG